MIVILHFLTVVVSLGAWFLLGLLEERLASPHLRFWVRGFRGACMGMVLSLFLAVALAHSPVVVVPDDSRTLVFLALALGFGMIGVPIGFLVSLARAQRESE